MTMLFDPVAGLASVKIAMPHVSLLPARVNATEAVIATPAYVADAVVPETLVPVAPSAMATTSMLHPVASNAVVMPDASAPSDPDVGMARTKAITSPRSR